MKSIYLTIITLLTATTIALGQGNPSNLPKDSSNTVQTLQLPTSRNYIVTHTYLKPFSSHPSSLKTGDSAPVVEYFDGLGRPIQTVAVRASQLASDMVDRQDYDQAGNPEKQWLPYARASNNGAYVVPSTFQSGQNTFLSDIYGTTDGSKGYAVTVYEKSPLSRVEKQGAPGAAWQTGTSDKPVKYVYRANTSADNVQTWKYTNDNYSSYTYPAGSLFVTETIDEDGKTVSEFKDKQGRLVMHLMGGTRTRYCYDEFGRLRCVVQPEGTSPASAENCFYYKYDSKGRLTDKRVPGSDWTIYIYDSRDRLVLSQDGNQQAKSPKEWSYTIYDNLNRPIEQGTWATTSSRATLVTAINSSLTYMVSAPNKVLLKNLYYDNYSGCPNGVYAPDTTALGVSNYSNNTGRLTWQKTRMLNMETGITEWQVTAYYYDKYGRVIQAVSDNHLAGNDYVTNQYNFTGQVTRTRHRHLADGITTYTDLYHDYDHRGRPVKEHYQINGGSQLLMAGYSYDETGAKRVQYLHSENNGAFLQKNDYTYNIRGWLLQMNNPASLIENDKFAMKLEYNNTSSPATPKYNGNIASFTWSTPNLTQARYVYSYDNNNRMTLADFRPTWNTSGYNESVTYDNNGNITQLDRYHSGTLSDRIISTYQGNRVTGLRDVAGDRPIIIDYPGTNTSYPLTYDYNGNVINEPHKLLGFGFNRLNLPYEINWNGLNRRINYYYNFDGAKLRKRVEDNGTLVKTDYCGPFIYETASGVRSLKYLITPYGRAVKNGSSWIYEYNLTDHLGNVRVVIKKGANNLAEVIQQKGYYPFGLEISQFSSGTGTNKYLYNGKEIQDDFNLYWYDYGARFYDPQLGRFHTQDRFAEKYLSMTPYQYGANNPALYIDINGDSIWITNRTGFLGLRSERLLYENGNLYKGGEVYEGKQSGYTRNTVNALDKIRTGGANGEALITGLQKSSLNLAISHFSGGNKFIGKGREMSIKWNPNSTSGGPNDQGNNYRPAFIGLSHELGHAEDWANFPIMDSRSWIELSDGSVITNAEKYAMHVENKIRAEHGLSLRTHYTQDLGRLVAPALISGTRLSSNISSFTIPAIPNFLPLINIPYAY